MKAKAIGLLMILGLGTLNLKAQEFGDNPDDCKKYRSIYGIFMNDKKYKEAIPSWKKVMALCPKSGEDLYKNGRYIYKSVLLPYYEITDQEKAIIEEVKKTQDVAKLLGIDPSFPQDPNEIDYEYFSQREKEVKDSVILISELYIENFGEDMNKLTQLGTDYMIYGAADYYAKAQPILKKVVEQQKETTPYYVVTYYFQSIFYQRKNKEISDDQYIDAYLQTSDLIDACVKADPDQAEAFEKTRQNVDMLFGAVIKDCEKIETVMSKIAETLPDDCAKKAEILKKFLALMNKKKCEDIPSYKTFAEELFKCDPSNEAAYNLASMYLQEKNYNQGLQYIKQAIDLCGDCEESGKYKLSAAKLSLALGNASGAITYAKGAVGYDASEAYEVIGKAITRYSGTCGNTVISRASVYWLASDYMQKAGKGADYYKANYPEKSVLFNEGVAEGSSYTVPCLGESTTVRAK